MRPDEGVECLRAFFGIGLLRGVFINIKAPLKTFGRILRRLQSGTAFFGQIFF